MKRLYEKETGKTTWHLTSWFDKMLVVLGWIGFAYLGLCVIAFLIGFGIGISEGF